MRIIDINSSQISNPKADHTKQRRLAEQSMDDECLMQARLMERAYNDLPPSINGVKREELIWADQISTFWRGWRQKDGAICLIRCIRSEWKNDAVFLRRMKRSRELFSAPMKDLGLPIWHESGDWPHLIFILGNGRMAVNDTNSWDELDWTVAIIGALKGLSILHERSLSLGVHPEKALVSQNGRTRLLWMDPFPMDFNPKKDIIKLAEWVTSNGDWNDDSVPALVADWVHSPPPRAKDALWIARHAMRDRLGDHAKYFRLRMMAMKKQKQAIRLHKATQALQQPPPEIDITLAGGKKIISTDGVLKLHCPQKGEKLVYSKDSGLVVLMGRNLRAECIRGIAEAQDKEQKQRLTQLRRWLQCTIQLRRLSALLRFQLENLF